MDEAAGPPPGSVSFETDLGVTATKLSPQSSDQTVRPPGKLALTAAADLAAFFALILLGFAYVWRRGDLDWVRAIDTPQSRSGQKLHLVR